ncbi:MAG: hypothetical protein H6701_06580 [Myxococcales bacterium]|nr:hypothetical protein [Myxococcales bacterium]
MPADCPGGQTCVDGRCVEQAACDAGLGCCALETCQGGFCAPAPGDDCAAGCLDPDFDCVAGHCVRRACQDDDGCDGGRCVTGRCVRGLPCDGLCAADQACYLHRDLCRRAPPACRQSCADGEVATVVDPAAYDGPACRLDQATCLCVGPPPVTPGGDARHAELGIVLGEPVFVAYDATYGDLVFVQGVDRGAPVVEFVDGVPEGGAITGDPQGPRGGRTEPGPDRGRYARLAVDRRGRVHVAYYDADQGAVRYVRRGADGRWSAPIVVDDEGDAGRYVRVEVGPDDRPRLVYSVVETIDGRAGLRYAEATTDAPASPADFRVVAVDMQPAPFDPAPPPGVLPARYGVRPCFRIAPDGAAVIGFHDGGAGRFLFARGGVDGFDVFPLEGTPAIRPDLDPGGRYDDVLDHALGAFCDLAVGQAGVAAVFTDERTWALLSYRGPVEGGGQIEIVDAGGSGQRRLVGADPSLGLDLAARAVVVYQDATDNTLRLGVRGPAGWGVPPLVIDDDGATGYANTLVLAGGEAIVGTLALGTLAGGRVESALRVLRVPLP